MKSTHINGHYLSRVSVPSENITDAADWSLYLLSLLPFKEMEIGEARRLQIEQ